LAPPRWTPPYPPGHSRLPPRPRRGGGPGGWRATGPDPVAILGERYARGEIDEQEYRSRLAVLREGRPQP
ncbi:SHOCT domain-containing protein, partial [Cellulosimicrobium funkei]|uniref:SHOCT domain-containing protein n=1 Tax=Cellulosimicrobium funkei TaxID=264251 RepID=UPI003F92B537